MIELIYGRENPILDQTIFEDRGAVTKKVFADPAYHVLLDLLDTKRVQTGALDLAKAAARFTMTVSEAAERLGLSTSAVRQAIAAKKIPAMKRGPVYFLDPHGVDTYGRFSLRRGPAPTPALRVRWGSTKGKSFRVKAAGLEEVDKRREGDLRLTESILPRWTSGQIAVAFSGEKTNRLFILEPGTESDYFEWGPFGIEGKYRIVEKVNDPAKASQRFKAFRAS